MPTKDQRSILKSMSPLPETDSLPGTSSLAQAMRKVFSFADAVGHLAHLFRARLDSAVARTNAHEEIAGQATRRHHGTAWALRFDHRLSMVCRRGGGMAYLGARIY